MEIKPIRSIVLIGAGKLATQLGFALKKQDIAISQVFNRHPERGNKLAIKLGASYISDLSAIQKDADLYIIAVSDAAIPSIAAGLNIKNRLLVHTSGSVDMLELKVASSRTGVFYPLQTFSRHKRISFHGIPLCIEAEKKKDGRRLQELGNLLSHNVHFMNSEQRRFLHLTAVFANNFTNYMYTIAGDLLQEKNISFDLLKPLIHQTAINAGEGCPFCHQTGPAVRDDLEVMQSHLEMLGHHPDYKHLYQQISKSIIQFKKIHGKLQGIT